jgi:general secretion pathway protein A
LRQLKQRIALRSQLHPLELEETEGYIRRRLQVAGNTNPDALFPFETVLEIYRNSRGIPRLINTLCENALVYGYARQATKLTPQMIEEIALDFRLNIMRSAPAPEQTVSGEPSKDVAQAAKTLLDLYASLRQAQTSGEELRGVVRNLGARERENEPYI